MAELAQLILFLLMNYLLTYIESYNKISMLVVSRGVDANDCSAVFFWLVLADASLRLGTLLLCKLLFAVVAAVLQSVCLSVSRCIC